MSGVDPAIREFHRKMTDLSNKDGVTMTLSHAGKSVTIGPETTRPQPINEDFDTLLNTEDDQPGPPYYDKTLNFLQAQFNKTNTAIGTKTDRKFKIEDEIEVLEQELETIRALLIEEYRERRPANPDTGELIDPPFGEEE